MKQQIKVLMGLHWFVGAGAVGGGLAAVVQPTGSLMGVTTEILQYGPFTDFLVPGIFLIVVLGAGNLYVGALLRTIGTHVFNRKALLFSLCFSGILILWILAQALVLGRANLHWLHGVYLLLGIAGSGLSSRLLLVSFPYTVGSDGAGVRDLFTGQIPHILMISLMIPGAIFLAELNPGNRIFLWLDAGHWLTLTIAVSVVHQLMVAVVFRTQLVFRLFSRLFGKADLTIWGVMFFPFLVLRVVTLVGVAAASAHTLPVPDWLGFTVGLLLLLPAGYTLYSVVRWFGLRRALGGDHFRTEFREMPLEKRGAFRYSGNAMYSYVFLGLWGVAGIFVSWPALVAALFQHAYIWVHWYCTEQPDMRVLYE
ncbi:methyltransferase [Spirochaeta africana]|uniref:Uncharacterized protein n=1 Tax=Spirochaeta africana (strain ATCC 700263 / DSM 8902 / Z-7692) TaxID=889378 RepID=H9UKZ2_SPIAZ|nr:methyltransferase [Spirochaeta africana]AFG38185.1 hypothetical protein Spiaf_2137 [Spirochaeta africana DSM 8902]